MKDNGKFMSMLAYVVLVIIAVVWAILLVVTILEAINVNVSVNLGWLQFISNILTTLLVVWAAWQYAKDKKKPWKVIFAIGAIIAVLSVVGVNISLIINN
ncbi:MAG: hypothetical protein GX931_02915 [Acholeplasmataceae bacterium]|jgi:ABC-type nickel/cobalt efflux system permease component RcnA|nr:hypothetical protein [Acholeplasmataceae bacterium]